LRQGEGLEVREEVERVHGPGEKRCSGEGARSKWLYVVIGRCKGWGRGKGES